MRALTLRLPQKPPRGRFNEFGLTDDEKEQLLILPCLREVFSQAL